MADDSKKGRFADLPESARWGIVGFAGLLLTLIAIFVIIFVVGNLSTFTNK